MPLLVSCIGQFVQGHLALGVLFVELFDHLGQVAGNVLPRPILDRPLLGERFSACRGSLVRGAAPTAAARGREEQSTNGNRYRGEAAKLRPRQSGGSVWWMEKHEYPFVESWLDKQTKLPMQIGTRIGG